MNRTIRKKLPWDVVVALEDLLDETEEQDIYGNNPVFDAAYDEAYRQYAGATPVLSEVNTPHESRRNKQED